MPHLLISMLKVVHISTYEGGGAGRAAYRLHEGLLKQPGIQSIFISASDTSDFKNTFNIKLAPKKISLIDRLLKRIGFPITKSHKNLKHLSKLHGSYECFSFPESDYPLESLEIIKQADIIHLHWVAGFVNYPTFFKRFADKNIVWTLHDMNPFMGGFHYQNDLLNNISHRSLNNKLLKLKRMSLSKLKHLTIVTPSEWLKEEAIRAGFFNNFTKFKRIQYGLNLQVFKSANREIAKTKFKLERKIPCILVIAENLEIERKGVDLFCKAIQKLSKETFQVISIGDNRLKIDFDCKIIELGKISDDRILAEAYSAADLIVIPSREDNLPNVLLEAFACGRPVLSFKVGGLIDWIEPGYNGFLAEAINENALREKLEEFILNPDQFDNIKIRKFAEDNFSQEVQAGRYLRLYNNVSKLGSQFTDIS